MPSELPEKSGIGALPREIWVLVGGNFIIAVGMGIVAPALPTFATSFNVGVTAASFVISAFALMRLGFAPVAGRLVAWFGERPVHIWGIAIVGVSSAACAFADSYWQLLVFRALGGTGSTMFTISGASLLVRLAPPRLRGRASGVWATSFLLGNVSGPLLGGIVVGYSLRLPFISYGIALFAASFLAWLLLRGPALTSPSNGPAAESVSVRSALTHRTYRAALLSNFSTGWAVFGVRIALVPLFVVEVLRAHQSIAGVALSVFAVGNAGVLLLSGRMSDRRGRRPLVLTGLGISALATAALGMTGSVPLFLLTSLIAGMGAGILNPAQQAAVADIVGPKGKGGPVLATFQMSADCGAILGPLVAGVLADTLSFQVAFLVTAATMLPGLLAWLTAPETLPAPPQDESASAPARS